MKRTALAIGVMLALENGAAEAQHAPPNSVPKTYGTNFQTLHVGGSAFRSIYGFETFFDAYFDGYLYNWDPSFETDVVTAPVTLPPGAEIHALCAYFYDFHSDADNTVGLRAGRLIPGGGQRGVVAIGPTISSSWDYGYGVACADFAPPYTYTEAAADDGVALTYYFLAQLPASNAIGGVKIIWRQQVSPAPASPTFSDVPAGHPFFQFVEALSASGITGGCAPGRFCPEAPLTRGQMAVFLAKALGLHWPY